MENSFLKDAINRIVELATPFTLETRSGHQFCSADLREVKPEVELPARYSVDTLEALVKLIRTEGVAQAPQLYVRVDSARRVVVDSTYTGRDYAIYSRLPGHPNVPLVNTHSAVTMAAAHTRLLPDFILGGELPEICLDACKAAKARGLTISCDLNFRKKLWTSQRAGEVMSQLLPYVDVCIANEEDAKDVFGIEAEGTDINSGKLNRDGYISVARQLSSRFGCKYVAITLRSSISANDNDWAGMLYEAAADKAYFSTTYHVHIVDRVGGGDSFGGGLIYSMLSGYDVQQTIDFAVAASCLKHSIEHDFNHVSVAEVAALAAGNASGRVQR